jgi:phosphonopyruvate decarboxylase
MKVSLLMEALEGEGVDFYTGVPDSQLKPLCNALMARYGISAKHRIAANEGNAVALAAGEFLATGRPACVYMQNSGLGNAVNPVCSLTHPKVYAIPMIFVVGWRGEPGVKDEPQHVYQGEITLRTLELLGIEYVVLDKATTEQDFLARFGAITPALREGRTVAVVVRKGALEGGAGEGKKEPFGGEAGEGEALPQREESIEALVRALPKEAMIVSSTGKISRELFEVRERLGQDHSRDFLTVGSMGHGSSIAMRIAERHPERPILCLDGDGAALMHLGAMALIPASGAPLIHVVLDNGAHETVGGMPTVAGRLDLAGAALALGYASAADVSSVAELQKAVAAALAGPRPAFIRMRVALGARADLGRPTRTPLQNRDDFMKRLEERL